MKDAAELFVRDEDRPVLGTGNGVGPPVLVNGHRGGRRRRRQRIVQGPFGFADKGIANVLLLQRRLYYVFWRRRGILVGGGNASNGVAVENGSFRHPRVFWLLRGAAVAALGRG